jgi:hypothetical protein
MELDKPKGLFNQRVVVGSLQFNMEYNEVMCELFMEHNEGGEPLTITGGGLLDSEERCIEYGKKSVGKMVRYWNGKESKAKCIGYKIWKRIF